MVKFQCFGHLMLGKIEGRLRGGQWDEMVGMAPPVDKEFLLSKLWKLVLREAWHAAELRGHKADVTNSQHFLCQKVIFSIFSSGNKIFTFHESFISSLTSTVVTCTCTSLICSGYPQALQGCLIQQVGNDVH